MAEEVVTPQVMADHIAKDVEMHKSIHDKLSHIKSKLKESSTMSEPVNIFQSPQNGGFHDGMFGGGGGLLGGLLFGSLLTNRGIFGNQGMGYDANNSNAHLTTANTLGDIKAQIPLTACQTQMEINSVGSNLQGQITASTNDINGNITSFNLANAARASELNTNVLTTSAATQALVAQMAYATATQVRDDGDKTRALIQSIDSANLNRQLGVAQNEALELRQELNRQRDAAGIQITMNNNQNQNNLQMQQQQQQINQLTAMFFAEAQNNRLTNQAINVGGLQQANPSNSNTNVRG